MFPLLLFQDIVEACSFQPILGQVLEVFVQWMVWHSFHLFSMCEKLSVPSRVKDFTPAGFCIVAIDALFIAPSVVLGPMLCTWSSLFVWVLAPVGQALAPYPSVGRTVPVHTVFRMRGDTPSVSISATNLVIFYRASTGL